MSDEVATGVRRSTGSYELAVAVVILGFAGWLADRWLETLPIFTAVFSVLGFLGASISIYYRYRESIARANENRLLSQADMDSK